MGADYASDTGVVVRCGSCRQKNRIAFSNLARDGTCGSCGKPLARLDAPVDVRSDGAFDALVQESPLPVLVDFWAAWCGPCVMVAPELAKVAAHGVGRLVVAKVNTEDLPVLAQRLHITSIPTMALFLGGLEVGRTQGARPAEGIRAFVDETLARARAET